MKRRTQFVIALVAAVGLILAGCDEPPEEEPVEEEEIDEPVAEPEEEPEYDEPDVDEDMFILADFEKRCVEQEIEDEDEAAEIIDEIYARYGFTEESFAEAAEEFDGDESVELQVETRMEECDEELARGFADEGAEELDEGDEDADDEADEEGEEEAAAEPAPEPVAQPPVTGSLTDGDVASGDFEDTSIELRIRSNFDVTGELRGEREGNEFVIPLRGSVDEDTNQISVSGERGGHTVDVDGRLSERGAEGRIEGVINERDFRLRYNAS